MVFGSCRRKTTTTSTTTTTTTPSPKSTLSLFRRKPPSPSSLAYLTTELDGTPDEEPLPHTPAQLSHYKSVTKSKAHVDTVLFARNRAVGQRTLQTGDGVLKFAGFRDWVSRKRLRERQMRGEKFHPEEDIDGLVVKSGGENETVMISRVKRIDPVKSGFMGKKTDRDETTGCGAGKFASKFAGRRGELERPVIVTTPQKGADDCTAATSCSPLSNSSGSVERPGNHGEKEDGWCGAFNTTTTLSTSPQTVPEDNEEEKKILADNLSESGASGTTAAGEEAGWCSSNNFYYDEDDDESEEDDDDDGEYSTSSSLQISGIRNVEVVYSEKKKKSRGQNKEIEI